MVIVDLLALIIFCISALMGYNKGFVKTLLGVIVFVGSVFIANIYVKYVTNYVVEVFGIRNSIEVFLGSYLKDNINPYAFGLEFNIQLVKVVTSFFDNIKIVGDIAKNAFVNNEEVTKLLSTANEHMLDNVTVKLVDIIMPSVTLFIHIVVFFVLFIISYIVLILVARYVNKFVVNLVLVGGVNRLLGLITGALRGIAIIVFLVYLTHVIVVITGDLTMFQGSFVFSLFDNLNKLK